MFLHISFGLIKWNISGVVTAELKEDYEGKPSLLIHPNHQMHCVNDDLSRDLSESDGEQFKHNMIKF